MTAGDPPAADLVATVRTHLDWGYARTDGRLRRLYERGKRLQWNATTDIDWALPVEFGAMLPPAVGQATFPFHRHPQEGTWDRFRWEFQAWMVSQFLHGEQGALLAAARLVETAPDLEAKLCAASQVADEARHVEVYTRYLHEKLGHAYPINRSLEALLRNILTETRWDVIYLGMQVIVEGLAVAAFRMGAATFHDPLIARITDLVARDEARHVSFGIVALDGLYSSLSAHELAEREEFVLEAADLMRRRFLLEEIWDRMELDRRTGVEYAERDATMVLYRQLLFAKVVGSLRRLSLMTPRMQQRLAALSLLPPGASPAIDDEAARW
jgi:hypothetical protein